MFMSRIGFNPFPPEEPYDQVLLNSGNRVSRTSMFPNRQTGSNEFCSLIISRIIKDKEAIIS
ncbi:MAG: hypothetical protein DWB56_07130 [Candidatus Jettenia sp.]|nr:hypothetical protein [Candidatus Jettenia sp.]